MEAQPKSLMPAPSYGGGIDTPDLPSSASWKTQVDAQFYTSWWNQIIHKAREDTWPAEEGFNPWEHVSGYELYAGDILTTRSTGELHQLKERIETLKMSNQIIANGDSPFTTTVVSGVVDPIMLGLLALLYSFIKVRRGRTALAKQVSAS